MKKYLLLIFVFVSVFALAAQEELFHDDGEDVWGYGNCPG